MKVDIKTVRKGQRIACLEVGFDICLVYGALDFVINQNHDDITHFGRLSDIEHFQSFFLCGSPTAATFPQPHDDVNAALFEVEGMSVSLAPISDYGYGLV